MSNASVIQTGGSSVKLSLMEKIEPSSFWKYLVASKSPMTHLGMLSRRKVRTIIDIILENKKIQPTTFKKSVF